MEAEFIILIFGTIFIFLVVLAVSFYVMAIYCHPEDKGFGASIFCKVLVVCLTNKKKIIKYITNKNYFL